MACSHEYRGDDDPLDRMLPETNPIKVRVVHRGGSRTEVFDAETGRKIPCHEVEVYHKAGELPSLVLVTRDFELEWVGLADQVTRVTRIKAT